MKSLLKFGDRPGVIGVLMKLFYGVLPRKKTKLKNYIDKYYGFINGISSFTWVDHFNFLGLRAVLPGLGPGNDMIALPLGLQVDFPVNCFYTISEVNPNEKHKTYTDSDFEKGIFYGLYFKPAYQFTFSRRKGIPWSFGIYWEADLLFLNNSEVNPKYLRGTGLKVCYEL